MAGSRLTGEESEDRARKKASSWEDRAIWPDAREALAPPQSAEGLRAAAGILATWTVEAGLRLEAHKASFSTGPLVPSQGLMPQERAGCCLPDLPIPGHFQAWLLGHWAGGGRLWASACSTPRYLHPCWPGLGDERCRRWAQALGRGFLSTQASAGPVLTFKRLVGSRASVRDSMDARPYLVMQDKFSCPRGQRDQALH